jgi:hypothetical protein
MTVTRMSPSANGAFSGVVNGMLWATRFIALSVCPQVLALSSFTT